MLKRPFTNPWHAGRLAALAIFAAALAGGYFLPVAADAAPAGCAALQAKYPQWKGKTLVNAINPHTPGYEAIDPNDPSKYVGFDIDLGEAIGDCLGFKLTYKPVVFAAMLTTLASGQADIVDAFRKMRRFLMNIKGLSEDEAIALMSAAVDFGVTQVVDGNWGVHAILSKRLFEKAP